ncbi:response regulator transcription factor [Spirosoma arcticum]
MIDSDTHMVESIRTHLRHLPADLIATNSGQDGLILMARQPVDLCILDSHSSDMCGLEVCRQIRQVDAATPIMMLTAMAQEADKVNGLEAGADDYLTKPVGIGEFMARVRAMLRRSSLNLSAVQTAPPRIVHGAMEIDVAARIVTIDGTRINLAPKEFDLLVLMAKTPGKSYRRKELLKQVWQYQFDGYEHTLTAHINRLRNKIEPNFSQPTYILTTWGVGYRFADPK